MTELSGRELATQILDELKKEALPSKYLALVVVGEDPQTASFIKQKEKTAELLGVDVRRYGFAETISQDDLRHEVGEIAAHSTCGGVVVQLPLPAHVNYHYVMNAIPREKDIDVLGERALGAFYAGRNPVMPPAVETVKAILESLKVDVRNAKVAIVGVGPLVGKPSALWASMYAQEVAIFRSTTINLEEKLSRYDVIVSGAGTPHLFSAEHILPGAIIIDFGYGEKDGRLSGDFNPEGHDETPGVFTPTPGGTGPILVAKLLGNFYILSNNER